MNELAVSTRHLVRSVLIAAFIVMLALTTAQRTSANQSGPGVNDSTQFQAALCQAGGGTATIEVERTVNAGLAYTKVRCTGGILDGMFCYNGQYTGTYCTFGRTLPQDQPFADASGVIEQVSVEPVQAPVTEDEVIQPAPAEQSTPESEAGDAEQAEDPEADSGDGQVADQPGTVDESVEPVVADEPVIEDAPVSQPTFEVVDIQELPVFIGQ